MSLVDLDFDWDPWPWLIAGLLIDFAGELNSFDEPMREAVKRMTDSIQANFAAEGRPAWVSAAESTKTWQSYMGGGSLLNRTGQLLGEATSEDNWNITSDSAEMTDGTQYGGFHQMGTETVPQREWATFQIEDLEAIQELFEKWLDAKLVGF